MSLSKNERVILSKEILNSPKKIESFDQLKAQILQAKQELVAKDLTNKSLQDSKSVFIDAYQDELKFINGQNRVKINEQDINNSLKKINRNIFFFMDDNEVGTIPFMSDGVWKNLTPILITGAIGKNFDTTYPVIVDSEQSLIPTIRNEIISFKSSYTEIQRTTGQKYVPLDPGPPPPAPPSPIPEHLESYTALKDALDGIKNKISILQGLLQSELSVATSPTHPETDPTRVQEKLDNINSINSVLSAIGSWTGLGDYKTYSGSPGNFNGTDPATIAPVGVFTKGYNSVLDTLNNALGVRKTICDARTGQIISYLGDVDQDSDSGDMISGTGLYGDRARILNLRLNMLGGSAQSLSGTETAINAVDQQKNTENNAMAVYTGILKMSPLMAPTNGTGFIHVRDSSLFSVGQTLYVMANSQQELSGTIEQITGNMIKISIQIPPTYRTTDGARVYVDLS